MNHLRSPSLVKSLSFSEIEAAAQRKASVRSLSSPHLLLSAESIANPFSLTEHDTGVTYEEWQRKQMERVVMATNSSPVDHSHLLNEKSKADVHLLIGGKTIYAHKVILEVRCPTILINNVKKKSIKKGLITIEMEDKPGITFKSVQSLLKFLYSANIQFFGKELDEVVQIMFTAKSFECTQLVKICERYFFCALNSSNWFLALKQSDKLNLQEAKSICFLFGKRHFNDLIIQKTGVATLGFELFYEVVLNVSVSQPKTKIESIHNLTREAYDQISSDFKKIYEEMHYADGEFVIGETSILCHTPLVVGQYPEMSKLFAKYSNRVVFPEDYDFDSNSVTALLKFLYYHDEKAINPFTARKLRKFAIDHGLVKLREICDKEVNHGISTKTVLSVLEFVRKAPSSKTSTSIEKLCMEFIAKNFQFIDFSKSRDANSIVDSLLLIQAKVIKNKIKLDPESKSTPTKKLGSRLGSNASPPNSSPFLPKETKKKTASSRAKKKFPKHRKSISNDSQEFIERKNQLEKSLGFTFVGENSKSRGSYQNLRSSTSPEQLKEKRHKSMQGMMISDLEEIVKGKKRNSMNVQPDEDKGKKRNSMKNRNPKKDKDRKRKSKRKEIKNIFTRKTSAPSLIQARSSIKNLDIDRQRESSTEPTTEVTSGSSVENIPIKISSKSKKLFKNKITT